MDSTSGKEGWVLGLVLQLQQQQQQRGGRGGPSSSFWLWIPPQAKKAESSDSSSSSSSSSSEEDEEAVAKKEKKKAKKAAKKKAKKEAAAEKVSFFLIRGQILSSWLWQRVVLPARQANRLADRPVRQPYAKVDFISDQGLRIWLQDPEISRNADLDKGVPSLCKLNSFSFFRIKKIYLKYSMILFRHVLYCIRIYCILQDKVLFSLLV